MSDPVFGRRRFLNLSMQGIAGVAVSAMSSTPMSASAATPSNDLPISAESALIFPERAPLTPEPGKKDARAVWARVPEVSAPAPNVALLYLHGNNNYVTVDAQGRPRVPDWAAEDPVASAGAAAKPAAPLIYELDKLKPSAGCAPLILVPEDATLGHGAFWAREPAGQYKDPRRLGDLIDDCCDHLARLSRPDGKTYLPKKAEKRLKRICLSGHSGAGLPLPEAAASERILPEHGVAADLWLFDCTYWSDIAGFVRFCSQWHAAERLTAGAPGAARSVWVCGR